MPEEGAKPEGEVDLTDMLNATRDKMAAQELGSPGEPAAAEPESDEESDHWGFGYKVRPLLSSIHFLLSSSLLFSSLTLDPPLPALARCQAIERKQVPIPRSYIELQTAFADAFPRHDEALVCERTNGRTIMTSETSFARDEVVVFREFQPEIRKIRTRKKIQGLRKGWEEDVYQKEVDNFRLKTWQR